MTTVQIIYEGEPNALREAIAAIQRRSAMTEHLPECAVAVARPGTFTSCICKRLRACEERTTAAAVQRVQSLAEPTQWRPLPRKTARISDVIASIKGG